MKKFLTRYVAMNPSHCVACWKCVEQCPKAVIGKAGFLFHKHAAFVDADACIGCKKCINACPHGVFFVPDSDFKIPSLWQRVKNEMGVTSLLPLLLLATIASGINLHVAGHRETQYAKHGWLVVHVVLTFIFTVFTFWHIVKRRK